MGQKKPSNILGQHSYPLLNGDPHHHSAPLVCSPNVLARCLPLTIQACFLDLNKASSGVLQCSFEWDVVTLSMSASSWDSGWPAWSCQGYIASRSPASRSSRELRFQTQGRAGPVPMSNSPPTVQLRGASSSLSGWSSPLL